MIFLLKKLNAQDVTLVSLGSGKSRTEALSDAFRNAINQAYGVFISTNTTILNDSIIKDEIIQISNGNIKKYDIISELPTNDNSYNISIKATVSVDKLKFFSSQKGLEVEFSGGMFSANIKLQELNELNEKKVLQNLEKIMKQVIASSINYSLEVYQPKITTIGSPLDSERVQYAGNSESYLALGKWELPMTVSITTNENIENAYEFLINTLQKITMDEQERVNYHQLNKNYFTVLIGGNNCKGVTRTLENSLYYDNNKSTGKYARNQFMSKLTSLNIPGNNYVVKFGKEYKVEYTILDTILFENDFSKVIQAIDNYYDKFKGRSEPVKILSYDPACLNPIYNFRNLSTVHDLINLVQYLKFTLWNFTIDDGLKKINGIKLYNDLTSYSYSDNIYRLNIQKDGFNAFVKAHDNDYYGSTANYLNHGSFFFSSADDYYQRSIKRLEINATEQFIFPFTYFTDLEKRYHCVDSLNSKFPFIFLANSMYNLQYDAKKAHWGRETIPSYSLIIDLNYFKKNKSLIYFSFYQFYTTDELGKINKFKIFSAFQNSKNEF